MSEAILGVPQLGGSGNMDFINSTNIECIGHVHLSNEASTNISFASNHNAIIANIIFDYDNGPFNVFLYPGDTKEVSYSTVSESESIQISLNSTGKTITAYKPSKYGIIRVGATGF